MPNFGAMFSKYRPISQEKISSEDDERLLEGSSQSSLSDLPRRRDRNPSWGLVVLVCVLVSFLSAALAVAAAARWGEHANDAFCTGVVSRKSPITEDIPITYHTVKFEGSFLEENIYRQKGSPEVDAAWEALGVDYRPIAVPEDRAAEAGLTTNHAKISDKYGGGYPANVEGLHHLHCLNLLRKSLFFNYMYYHDQGEGAFLNNDYIVRKHVTHCLDIIRQQLMCTVDIGVLGQVWWRNDTMERAEPFVDFNTEHTCRNYDDIRKWAEQRQLPASGPNDFLVQPSKDAHVYDAIP